MEVFYTDSDDHIYQISSSDNISWSQQDLTTLTHSPSTSSEDAITAFATTPNNQLHVYYISSSSQSLAWIIHEVSSQKSKDALKR